MAATHLRRNEREDRMDDSASPTNSIGGFGWLAVFTIFAVAMLLITYA